MVFHQLSVLRRAMLINLLASRRVPKAATTDSGMHRRLLACIWEYGSDLRYFAGIGTSLVLQLGVSTSLRSRLK